MSYLLKSPMLLALVALFFAIGHGHQIFERFETHDHAYSEQHHNHGVAGHSDHEVPGGGDDHCAWHHGVPAVIEVGQELLVRRLEILSEVESRVVLPPDAPVLGIEHPPQITIA